VLDHELVVAKDHYIDITVRSNGATKKLLDSIPTAQSPGERRGAQHVRNFVKSKWVPMLIRESHVLALCEDHARLSADVTRRSSGQEGF
jgi:hypothetical protein